MTATPYKHSAGQHFNGRHPTGLADMQPARMLRVRSTSDRHANLVSFLAQAGFEIQPSSSGLRIVACPGPSPAAVTTTVREQSAGRDIP
jgi:hypothetical protein